MAIEPIFRHSIIPLLTASHFVLFIPSFSFPLFTKNSHTIVSSAAVIFLYPLFFVSFSLVAFAVQHFASFSLVAFAIQHFASFSLAVCATQALCCVQLSSHFLLRN